MIPSNRMSTTWINLIVLLTLIVFVSKSCDGAVINKRYNSVYGGEVVRNNVDGAQNLMRSLLGVTNFLNDGGQFSSQEMRDMTPKLYSTYDFIVIGAGTAGATIASRLSEVSDIDVLLIEAGGDETLIMDIPLAVVYLQFSPEINWQYQTEPSNRYCTGMNNQRCNWPRGKVMGGSSVLNYMIATRGHPKDYDRWAELGNNGWSYEDLLPYFKKLETLDVPNMSKDRKKRHSTTGPVNIAHPVFHTPLADAFLEAGHELGYPLTNYTGESEVGFSYLLSTTKNGTRMSSNRAYLHPARNRRNLHVSKKSMVTRILIDPKTKRAVGVKFVKNGQEMIVYARKEVILSAGAIGSAQLMMLSGIGPAKHLRQLGIKVIKDAPVGNNLMDHIAYGGLSFTIDQPAALRVADMVNPAFPYLKDFLIDRLGPLTVPGGCEAIAFVDVDKPGQSDAFANIELLFLGAAVTSDPVLYRTFGIRDDLWVKSYGPILGKYAWTILPMILRPKSRGTIRLKSNNPWVKPEIIANYLDDREDVRIMIKGVRAAIDISRTPAMKKFNSQLFNASLPGCDNYQYDSDEYWECAIRTLTFNIYHYSGTCKMGPRNDPTAVVDPRLKVIGVEGLRVADASIMPEIISGHPNIPVYMIGEKAADMVKEDHGYL